MITKSGPYIQNKIVPEQGISQCVYCSENHNPFHCLTATNLGSRI